MVRLIGHSGSETKYKVQITNYRINFVSFYTRRGRSFICLHERLLHRVLQKQGSRCLLRSLHESQRDESQRGDCRERVCRLQSLRERANLRLLLGGFERPQWKYISLFLLFHHLLLSIHFLFLLSENLRFSLQMDLL